MSLATEFPTFPALEFAPSFFGFSVDTSWHEDACPSFATPDYKYRLLCHFPAATDRPARKTPRFVIERDDDGKHSVVFATESATALLDYLARPFQVLLERSSLHTPIHFTFDGVTVYNPYGPKNAHSPLHYGFSVQTTLRGQHAYVKSFEDGTQILITDRSGHHLPTSPQAAWLSFYDTKGSRLAFHRVPTAVEIELLKGYPSDETVLRRFCPNAFAAADWWRHLGPGERRSYFAQFSADCLAQLHIQADPDTVGGVISPRWDHLPADLLLLNRAHPVAVEVINLFADMDALLARHTFPPGVADNLRQLARETALDWHGVAVPKAA